MFTYLTIKIDKYFEKMSFLFNFLWNWNIFREKDCTENSLDCVMTVVSVAGIQKRRGFGEDWLGESSPLTVSSHLFCSLDKRREYGMLS